jgi:uncharacterized protein YegL
MSPLRDWKAMDELSSVNRRLPVYLLLDCSGSMAGDAIQSVQTGLKALLSDLRQEPQALDTVWLSLITFASAAELVVPLTDIGEFEPIPLTAGGGTALGAAVDLLAERIEHEVRKTTPDQKGDWKPLVFILTDGEPNDVWEESVDRFRAENRAVMIACGAGPGVNDQTLQRLGDKVIRLSDTRPGTLGAFMQWVSAAVSTASQAVGTLAGGTEDFGPVPEDRGVTRIE